MSINTTLSENIAFSGHVSPSDQLITLTIGQLRDLIAQAVQEAIQPLQERISALEEERDQDRRDIADLRQSLAALESSEEQDISRLALDIAYDRQRISKLEKPVKSPGKTEISRAEKIERYLSSRPDHKATFETLKGHLGIDKDRLKEAIKTLMASEPGRYGIIRAPGDKRKRILVMLPR